MNEQGTDSTDDHSKWNVNDPMNSEIKDGENENNGIDENEHVIAIVTPLLERLTIGFDMKIVEHQDAKWDCNMERWYCIVERIMCCIEG